MNTRTLRDPNPARWRERACWILTGFAAMLWSAFAHPALAQGTAATSQPAERVQSRRSDLHEKNTLAVSIIFPITNSIIDQGTMPLVPIDVQIDSGTPPQSVTVQVCESTDGIGCLNVNSPRSVFNIAPGGPYQAMWTPPPYAIEVTTSFKFLAWASVRNAAGETTTSATTMFTYVMPPSRKATLLAPPLDTGFFAPASPVLWASVSKLAADPTTIDHVDFMDGSGLIGTVQAPNSTPSGYALLWKSAPEGAHEVWARGVDSTGRSWTSPSVSLYVVPTPGAIDVALTSPHTGETFAEAVSIELRANASVAAGTIERVEFVDGATTIGTAFDAPYSVTWNAPSIGIHAISARAFDDLGNASASSAAYVRSLGSPGVSSIILTSPAQGAVVALSTPIVYSSVTSTRDSPISRVEYSLDGAIVGSSTTSPYSVSKPATTLGKHSAVAVAYDVAGHQWSSAAIAFSVVADDKPPPGGPNPPPSVTVSAPASGASFVEGDTIHLTASASQIGGSIARVEFTANGALVGASTASPWNANWSGATPGDYAIIATATNNAGVSASSPAVTVHVVPAPASIVMAAPPPGAIFYAGDSIGLHPATMHVSGAVAHVDYYIDGTLAGSATVAPYTYEWDPAAPGTYSVTARVFDTAGNSAQSTPVTLVVKDITIHILSPLAGANIDGPSVPVEGTYEGPANTGVVVNDVIAINDGHGHFFVNDISLPAITNTIKATATSMGGSRQSTSITVTASAADDPSAPNIFASESEGIDALSTRIAVSHPEDVASFRVLDLGSGTMGPGAPGSGDVATLNFATPGLFTPTMEITDKQGKVTRKRIVVLVSSSTEVVSSRMAIVNQFTDALFKQQKNRAVATLTAGLANQFSSIYDALHDHWPDIVRSFGSVGATMYSTETFEAAVTRMHDGQKYLYLIEGMRDSDGVWRIDSF